MVQLLFFEEHLMGSSGGVESTAWIDRKIRTGMKARFGILLECSNGIVESFGFQYVT